jgi:hypothetical protein
MKYIFCSKCGELSSNYDVCDKCGKDPKRSPTPKSTVMISCFRSGYYEHIDYEPIYIKNRKQLMDECAARGVRSSQAW